MRFPVPQLQKEGRYPRGAGARSWVCSLGGELCVEIGKCVKGRCAGEWIPLRVDCAVQSLPLEGGGSRSETEGGGMADGSGL